SSEIRKHAVQTARVLGTNVVRLPEVALPLGRLLGEDVAAVGVACLVLAGSGLPEALGRAPMRLDLGHCDVLGVVSSTGPGGVRDCGSSFHPAWPVCKPLISAGNQGRSKVLRTASPENRAGHYACRRAGLQSGSPPCCLPRSRGGPGWARRSELPEKRSAPDGAPPPPFALPRKRRRGTVGIAACGSDYFFFGAIIITICRPSRRGRDSMTMSSPRSASIRAAISRPSSWWLISRPRKRMLTLILSPSSRKPRILRSLIW